ncbi:MAG: glycosyltransferase, partial [Candidatus Aenigmatarchaeota archaeon]
MKVILICRSFEKNSGQGIYKMAGYLYENLKRCNIVRIEKIESKRKNPYFFDLIICPMKVSSNNAHIYHFLMPEVCLPLILSKQIRERSVVTIHDTIVYRIKERKWISEKYIKLFYNIAKNAQIIHTPSLQSKNDIVKFLKIPEEKVKVIPWGIDLEFFKPIKKKHKRNILIAGYIGGLGKRKNTEWIIRVAKNFENTILFKIAGKGPQLKKLKSLAKRLNVKNVEFVGFIKEKNLPQFYNSLDIFIFPSLYEGFG